MSDQRNRLESGITRLGLTLPEGAVERLLDYLTLLIKWNRAYNLTAVRNPQQMVVRHLLDSLAVAPHLLGERVIDVGSGAGLPGIPLAIAFPERHFTLLDSNGKKSRFLVQARGELRLDNVEVVNKRVENFHPAEPFDTVITRAFASVADMLAGSRHLIAPDGEFLAMKGGVEREGIEALPQWAHLRECIGLTVPGLEGEQRHLLRIALRQESCLESG